MVIKALYSNTSQSSDCGANTAVGYQALFSNTTGCGNTAIGDSALYSNVGNVNTAIGDYALAGNTGDRNVGTGYSALGSLTSGGHNVGFGNCTFCSMTTGEYNTSLGFSSGWNLTSGDNNIIINNVGVVGTESNTIRIGSQVAGVAADGSTQAAHTATYIAGISGQTAAGGVAVFIDSDGKLGTLTSSARFKDAIKPMDKSSEAILALKPVTFRYKKELDPENIPQFGLVAEEVEKVNPDLVVRDADGKPYTVRYDAVNAMLLNEFLKEHRKLQELEAKLAQQQKDFTARLEEQDAKIQRVNDRVELNEPSPRTVDNN